MISDDRIRGSIASALLLWVNEQCKEKGVKVDAVVGIAQGGIVWASCIANSNCLPLLYAFAKRKDHGLFNQIAGELPKNGAKVVVIDDAITTGFSAIEVVKALREGKNGKKAEVLSVYSIFDWNFDEVNKKFQDAGIEKRGLVSVDQLLEYGVEHNYLDADTVKRLKDFYRKD